MATYAYTFTSGDTVTPTKLNNARTVSEIVNADVSATAAIAGTKVAPAFGAQDITVSGAARSITNTGNFALSFGTNNTERVRINNAGNVGIGTNTPNTRLQVAGGVARIEGSGGEGGHLELLNVANSAVQAIFDVDGYDVTRLLVLPAGNLTFGTNSVERIRITAAGNVGIGTGSPAFPVHIYAAASSTYARLENGSTVDTYLSFKNAGSADESFVGLAGAGSGTYLWDRAERPLIFGTSNAERVRINTLGNVGIGTSSPRGRIDIAGGALAGVGNMHGNSDNSGFSVWGGESSLNGGYIQFLGGSFAGAPNTLVFGSNSSEKMRLTASGNLSIGTASPSSRLHVDGDLTMSSATTTAGAGAVVGYLVVSINGTSRKIPVHAT
jgi:hypothetical protein